MPKKYTAKDTSLHAAMREDILALQGRLDVHTLMAAARVLQEHDIKYIDLSELTALDTPGALFLCTLDENIHLSHVRPEHHALLNLIRQLELKPFPEAQEIPGWRQFIIKIGRGAADAWQNILEIITFIGRTTVVTTRAFIHPRNLRLPPLSHYIEETGIHALPIIGLMAIMISVVVGYQGVAQLRPYGSEELTVNLVAVSVLREMGVLVTAIMVSGRSGSAFAAELGMMKAREEIDALEVMGLKPMELLVVPRVIGLVIALPLLTFFADIMGLLGGAGITNALLGLSLLQYLDRVRDVVKGWDLFVGLIKAPFFAFLIATIGCMHGMKVRGSAESVGKETTSAVVQAIFVVLMLDALFSVLFEELKI